MAVMSSPARDRGPALAYVLIVVMSAVGFLQIQRANDRNDEKAEESRKRLCQISEQQTESSRVILQGIVDLVVQSSPRRTPQEVAAADASKAVILKFQSDVLARLPKPNCEAVANGGPP